MNDIITTALKAARACIQQDRQALADSHTSVDGLDEDGAAGVAEYDEVLQQIDLALRFVSTAGPIGQVIDSNVDRIRDMADSLDCLTEEDLALLTGASPRTLRHWRKAGEGPSYVQACRRPLYPRQEVAKWMLTRMRTCAPRNERKKEGL